MFKQRERLYFSLLSFEKKLFVWLISERHKIFIVLLVVFLMWGLSLLPYLNLLINTPLIVLVVIVSSLILFNVKYDRVILLAVLLFLPAFLGVLLEEYRMTEFITGYIYGFLLLGTVLAILELRK